jgi:hypothetical protein
MSTILGELQTFLEAASVTPVKQGQLPANPNTCVAVYEYGGLAPSMTFGAAAIAIEYPRVQVVARGEPKDYVGPRAVAETAYRAMAAAAHQSISSTRYLAMEPIQPPFLLRKDSNDRYEIAFSVQITKELSA